MLGCDHSVIDCRAADLRQLPDVAGVIDQPIGDAIILPMFHLNKVARKSVKAVLTGEGADELLDGIRASGPLQLRKLSSVLGVPGAAAMLGVATRVLPVRFWDMFFSYGGSIGRAGAERMLTLLREINSATRQYLNYTSLFGEQERRELYDSPLAPLASREAPAGFSLSQLEDASSSARQGLMRTELQAWSRPDNILTKQDSLGMSNGLEARVPYLDHRLVEEVVGWDEATFRTVARNKGVLRRALEREWPALPRSKKRAFRLDFHPGFRPMLVELTQDIVLRQGSTIGDLVRKSRVKELLETFRRQSVPARQAAYRPGRTGILAGRTTL